MNSQENSGVSWLTAERTLEGFRPLRQIFAPTFSAAGWAALVGTSTATVSRTETTGNEVGLGVAWNMAARLGVRLEDLLNLSAPGSLDRLLTRRQGLFKLPHPLLPYAGDPAHIRSQFEGWNNPATLQTDFYIRYSVQSRAGRLAEVVRLLAGIEEKAGLPRREYGIKFDPATGREAPVRLSAGEELPPKIELGEVFYYLMKLRGLNGVRITELTRISSSMLSRLLRDGVTPMLTSVDRLAGVFGLTIDELVWLKYPSPTRWIFLVEDRPNYRSPATAEWFSSQEAIDNFVNSNVEERATLMLEFHKWWEYENWASSTENSVLYDFNFGPGAASGHRHSGAEEKLKSPGPESARPGIHRKGKGKQTRRRSEPLRLK